MQTIHISRQCFDQVADRNVDYFIREILGVVDYNISSSIKVFPNIFSDEKKEITIEDETYNEIRNNFKSLQDINAATEILIWSYLLLGSNL